MNTLGDTVPSLTELSNFLTHLLLYPLFTLLTDAVEPSPDALCDIACHHRVESYPTLYYSHATSVTVYDDIHHTLFIFSILYLCNLPFTYLTVGAHLADTTPVSRDFMISLSVFASHVNLLQNSKKKKYM